MADNYALSPRDLELATLAAYLEGDPRVLNVAVNRLSADSGFFKQEGQKNTLSNILSMPLQFEGMNYLSSPKDLLDRGVFKTLDAAKKWHSAQTKKAKEYQASQDWEAAVDKTRKFFEEYDYTNDPTGNALWVYAPDAMQGREGSIYKNNMWSPSWMNDVGKRISKDYRAADGSGHVFVTNPDFYKNQNFLKYSFLTPKEQSPVGQSSMALLASAAEIPERPLGTDIAHIEDIVERTVKGDESFSGQHFSPDQMEKLVSLLNATKGSDDSYYDKLNSITKGMREAIGPYLTVQGASVPPIFGRTYNQGTNSVAPLDFDEGGEVPLPPAIVDKKLPKQYIEERFGGDIVPAMLTPGEAVIPAETAQDPEFQPIIDLMIQEGRARQDMKELPKQYIEERFGGDIAPARFNDGTLGALPWWRRVLQDEQNIINNVTPENWQDVLKGYQNNIGTMDTRMPTVDAGDSLEQYHLSQQGIPKLPVEDNNSNTPWWNFLNFAGGLEDIKPAINQIQTLNDIGTMDTRMPTLDPSHSKHNLTYSPLTNIMSPESPEVGDSNWNWEGAKSIGDALAKIPPKLYELGTGPNSESGLQSLMAGEAPSLQETISDTIGEPPSEDFSPFRPTSTLDSIFSDSEVTVDENNQINFTPSESFNSNMKKFHEADNTNVSEALAGKFKTSGDVKTGLQTAFDKFLGLFGMDRSDALRMAAYYVGGRLTGGSHGGSLQWALKQGLTDVSEAKKLEATTASTRSATGRALRTEWNKVKQHYTSAGQRKIDAAIAGEDYATARTLMMDKKYINESSYIADIDKPDLVRKVDGNQLFEVYPGVNNPSQKYYYNEAGQLKPLPGMVGLGGEYEFSSVDTNTNQTWKDAKQWWESLNPEKGGGLSESQKLLSEAFGIKNAGTYASTMASVARDYGIGIDKLAVEIGGDILKAAKNNQIPEGMTLQGFLESMTLQKPGTDPFWSNLAFKGTQYQYLADLKKRIPGVNTLMRQTEDEITGGIDNTGKKREPIVSEKVIAKGDWKKANKMIKAWIKNNPTYKSLDQDEKDRIDMIMKEVNPYMALLELNVKRSK